MNTKQTLLLLASSCVATLSFVTYAENALEVKSVTDLRIRVIDTGQIATQAKQAIESRTMLEQTQAHLSQELQREAQQIQKEAAAFEQKRSALTESAREQEQASLRKRQMDYEHKGKASQDNLKLTAAQEQEKLITSIVDSAKEYAVKENIDIVVDKNSGAIIYNSQKSDCTSHIMKIMDGHYDYKIQLAQSKKNESTQLASNTAGQKAIATK